MSGVVLTAHVKDPAKWEKSFRTHADLFRQNHIPLIHYTITQNNDIVMYSETDDFDAYRSFVRSPEVARAMEEDGVERDTVKIYPLEKDLSAS